MSPVVFGIVTVVVFAVGAWLGWLIRQRTLPPDTSGVALGEAKARAVDAEGKLQESQKKVAALTATNTATEQRASDFKGERDAAREAADKSRQDLADYRAASEADKAKVAAEKESLQQQVKALTEAEQRLTMQFEAVGGKVLKQTADAMSAQGLEKINLVLKPLEKSLDELRNNLTAAGTTQAALSERVDKLATSHLELTKSLIGDSKAQGDWGEQTLIQILDTSGLVRGKTYEVQARFKNEDGKDEIPDIVVHMPEKRDIIIDSKVSLTAYHAYLNAVDPVEKRRYLSEHAASVKGHIRDLAKTKYDHIPGLNPLRGIFLWMYSEGAVHEAVAADKSIIDDAIGLRIYPVGPTNLIAMLTMVDELWRMEQQTASVKKIFDRAELFHHRLTLFTQSLDKVKMGLDTAQQAYQEGRSRFLDGKGSVKWQLTELHNQGVKAKVIPEGEWADTEPDDNAGAPPTLPAPKT